MDQGKLRGDLEERLDDLEDLQSQIDAEEKKISGLTSSSGWSQDPKSAEWLEGMAGELKPLLEERGRLKQEIKDLEQRYKEASGKTIRRR